MKQRNFYLSIVSICTTLLALMTYVFPSVAATTFQKTTIQKSYHREAYSPSNHTTTNNTVTPTLAIPQYGDDVAVRLLSSIAPVVKPVDTEPIPKDEEPGR